MALNVIPEVAAIAPVSGVVSVVKLLIAELPLIVAVLAPPLEANFCMTVAFVALHSVEAEAALGNWQTVQSALPAALISNRTNVARWDASLRARRRPFWIDSAALRILLLSIHC